MPDTTVFYVKALVQGTGTSKVPAVYQYVPAEYLSINGANVIDPYWSQASANDTKGVYQIYTATTDGKGNVTYVPSSTQNTGGYYIVPAGFSNSSQGATQTLNQLNNVGTTLASRLLPLAPVPPALVGCG